MKSRGNSNGGASIRPTRCASTIIAMVACSLSAIPRISCRSSGCAGSTTGWRMPTISPGSSASSSTARQTDALLDSYSPERRGATLDVFANATKSTRFMTPPTRGWRLAREAALSLSLKHEFPRDLANPRQMQPYTYSESPLTPFAGRDAEFTSGAISRQRCTQCEPGRRRLSARSRWIRHDRDPVLRGAPTGEQCRTAGAARQARQACRGGVDHTGGCRPRSRSRIATAISPACSAAEPGTLYLLRPDLHIAGRWKTIAPDEVLRTAAHLLGEDDVMSKMPFDDFETAYEALATAIDQAGPGAKRCSSPGWRSCSPTSSATSRPSGRPSGPRLMNWNNDRCARPPGSISFSHANGEIFHGMIRCDFLQRIIL